MAPKTVSEQQRVKEFGGLTLGQLLRGLDLRLYVTSPIHPGDPILYSWTSQAYLRLDLGQVTVSLFLLDDLGQIGPAGLLREDNLTANVSQQVANGGVYQSGQLEAFAPAGLENRIYRAGMHWLKLELKGTGKSGPYESVVELLRVDLPTIDDSWWMWTVPPSRMARWKQDMYIVSGTFTNKSTHPVTVNATLLEKNTSDTHGIPIADTSAESTISSAPSGSAVAPNGNFPVTSASVNLAKTWSWFIGGIFVPAGPQAQIYTYRARLDVTDQFQNPYPPFFTTQNVVVNVVVTQQKIAADALAVVLLEQAAIMLIIAAATATIPIYGWAAAGIEASIAGGLAAAAAVSGVVAGDPPVEDRRFEVLVEPTSVTFPDDKEHAPLVRFLDIVADVVAHAEVLGQTDSRIAGARAAGAKRSLQKQLDQFEAIRGELPPLRKAVRRALPKAVDWLTEKGRTPGIAKSDELIARLLHDLEFRAGAQKAWAEAGGDPASYHAVEQVLTMPEFGEVVTEPEAALVATGLFAERLAIAAASTQPEE